LSRSLLPIPVRRAGLPDIPVEVRNKRPKREDLLAGRADRLTRIQKIYAKDIEAFGYAIIG